MWVYTEYGQRRAELFGNNNRKAGQPATCGKAPVTGRTAEGWEKSGYIVWKEEDQDVHQLPIHQVADSSNDH